MDQAYNACVFFPFPFFLFGCYVSFMSEMAPFECKPELLEPLWDEIADALASKGYILLDQPLPAAITQGLISHLAEEESRLVRAGVGRQQAYQLNDEVRGDKIQWLEPSAPAVHAFLAWMDALRVGLNQRLFLGLLDYESHYAIYEPGAFYRKHVDAFRGKPGRKLSTVFYLNEDWDENNGGELVLYDGADDRVLERVAPLCGRMIVFLSEDFPHEVMAARVKRQSIAGWFRIKAL